MQPPVVTRDAAPLGGENAIVPHPTAIAYYENAEGTTAFEVSIDERGAPVKCTNVKSSGFVVLDEAVCRAAMRVRYAPRTINGRAVPGVYRDALTFQAGDASVARGSGTPRRLRETREGWRRAGSSIGSSAICVSTTMRACGPRDREVGSCRWSSLIRR